MSTRNPRIDAYITNSPEFSRPILTYLRDLVHSACPEVEETMKWSRPHFLYKGMLCAISAFKEHCSLSFWNSALQIENGAANNQEGMGQFGRITSIADLPPQKVLAGYVKEAMKLNEEGVKGPSRMKPKGPKPELVIPEDLASALAKNAKAAAVFDAFSPSKKREYIEWLTEAKTAATRMRRLDTAVQWISEGKERNWKYMNC